MARVIGVLSIKGGVGKTSTVVSLGAALASFGQRVLLVDANFSAPNLGVHLDVIDPERTVHHVLNREINMAEAVHSYEDFHFVPASMYPTRKFDPLKLKKHINEVKHNYDFILIDSSPALNDETLATILSSDEVFVITTPDFSTLSMTLKAIRAAQKKGTKISGLLLNKVHGKDFELGIEDIEKTIEVPVLGVFPHDVNVMRAQSSFVPPVYLRPNSDFSHEHRKLAACLSQEEYNPFRLKDIFQSISPKRQDINREIFFNS